MNRRDLLSYGLAIAGTFVVRRIRAAEAGGSRTGFVIGVDKAGDLPVLRAAKTGARDVANWLRGEGFDVKVFLDDGNPVKASDIFDAGAVKGASGLRGPLIDLTAATDLHLRNSTAEVPDPDSTLNWI